MPSLPNQPPRLQRHHPERHFSGCTYTSAGVQNYLVFTLQDKTFDRGVARKRNSFFVYIEFLTSGSSAADTAKMEPGVQQKVVGDHAHFGVKVGARFTWHVRLLSCCCETCAWPMYRLRCQPWMYMCIYTYVYIYMVYTYVYIYIYTHIYISYIYTYVYTYIYIYTYTYAFIHIYM